MGYKITALKTQKRNPQRVNVYLDGVFAFGLARIVAAWLQVGQELSDEKISSLKNVDGQEATYQLALRFLENRSHSEVEVRRNLEKHQAEEQDIDATLERLRRAGLVNDAGFAKNWVDNRNEFRPRSRRALSFELRRRGVDDEAISEALQTLDDEPLAYQAGLKQAGKLHDLDWKDFRQKLSSFLARRGFNYEVIQPVVARIWEESQTPAGGEE